MDCMCEFDDECNGLGTLHCRGCGGDLCVCACGGELCVCACGGELDCDGCPNCMELDPMDRIGDHDSDEEDCP